MSQNLNTAEAISRIDSLLHDGWENQDIFDILVDEGYTKQQIYNLFVQSGLTQPNEKSKNGEAPKLRQRLPVEDNNPLEDALGGLLTLGMKYGLPLILLVFGVAYVWGEIVRDLDVGIRSAAAAIMPMAITLAFAKSDVRHNAVNFLSDNKLVAFAFTFALAMGAAAAAMTMRQFNNVIPVGELAFSTTLALMIFGNKGDGDVSMVHIGAVSGLLTYVVLFGLAI